MDSTGTVFFPAPSSTMAGEIDALFYFIYYLGVFFFALICGLIALFVYKYRRKGAPGLTTAGESKLLEVAWTVIPTTLFIIIFAWGFRDFMRLHVIPHDALEIKVTGVKWSWNFEYPNGATSVSELIVPENRPVKLLMSSRDVIHSFFVPAFRVKMDVLPNRYTTAWFEATRQGEFRLFCAEYCGQQHSEMLGLVKVVSDSAYYNWLDENSNILEGLSPIAGGELLYNRQLCYTCHSNDGTAGNGPTFKGLFGKTERLEGGDSVEVDENFLRRSILEPQADISAGFQPIMPSYQGMLKAEHVDALIAYIKSLNE
jgi:cytochrome c oxidase subunit II